MKTAADILDELSDLYRERNAAYKDNFRNVGPTMAGLFPNGLELRTAEDFERFHLLMLAVVKLSRYAVLWPEGHSDSLRDGAVYLAMLESVDAQRRL